MDAVFTPMPASPNRGEQGGPVQQPVIVPNSTAQAFQKKRDLRKFFNLSSWIFLFTFLPITVLIFLSQDSLPGDNFYPIKRGLENVILAAASVNPATRAAFRTDLTEARFKEAQSLVIAKANAGGLVSFADDVQAVQLEVTSLANDTERAKAEEKLLVKIDQYQNSLSNLQAKTEQNLIAYSHQGAPTSIPPTSAQNLPSGIPTLTPSPTLIPTTTLMPTPAPVKSFDPEFMTEEQASSPSPEASAPTLTPIPTAAPSIPIQQENTQVEQQEEIAQTIKETKTSLERIKKDIEEKRGKNKNENIQKSAGSSENKNQDKNNPDKETEIPSRQK